MSSGSPVALVQNNGTASGSTSSAGSGFNVGPSQQQASVPEQHPQNAYAWLVAWGVLFLVLYGINRTRVGHVAIYYILVLMIVFLLVTQYHAIAAIWSPFSQLNAGFAPGGTNAGTSDSSTTANQQNVPAAANTQQLATAATGTAGSAPNGASALAAGIRSGLIQDTTVTL